MENFEIGATISLRIPKEDRRALDYSRLYARVLAQPHPGRYELQTAHGILDWLFPTADLNRVPCCGIHSVPFLVFLFTLLFTLSLPYPTF